MLKVFNALLLFYQLETSYFNSKLLCNIYEVFEENSSGLVVSYAQIINFSYNFVIKLINIFTIILEIIHIVY